MNNTIAECDRGITIMNVDSRGTSVKSRTFRVYRDAAVENNIVYNYTSHGIQIGQNISGPVREPDQTEAEHEAAQAQSLADNPDFADKVAGAWSPFTDWDRNGLLDVDTPNPIIPVRNNCVSPGGTQAFVGADWYAYQYPNAAPYRYGETTSNPLLDASDGYKPEVEITEGATARKNGVLPASDPILGKGNPYRIDYDSDLGKAMRRSMGAYEVLDTDLNPTDYYSVPVN